MGKYFIHTGNHKPGSFSLDEHNFHRLAKNVQDRLNGFPIWTPDLKVPALTTLSGFPPSFNVNMPVATLTLPSVEPTLNIEEKPRNPNKFTPYLKAAVIVSGMVISCLMYPHTRLLTAQDAERIERNQMESGRQEKTAGLPGKNRDYQNK